ncbi:MAG: DNA repair protein RecO [Neomegalonema sp.]|nr:DNA repair protein RecO [Neomegalonema sp.]
MQWRDEGILLSSRKHGESAAILDVFTRAHGRHSGLLYGGASRKKAAFLQPGTQLSLEWRARLDDQLGTFRAEPIRSRAGVLLDNRLALAGLSAACALAGALLAEREPMPEFFAQTEALFDHFHDDAVWPSLYAFWELRLLEHLGFGLDLSACAVSGQTQELTWVSPRTGRAVSRAMGEPYADRLLPLPGFLRLGDPCSLDAFGQALHLTGHFLNKFALPELDIRSSIPARDRLVSLAQQAARGR